DAMSASLYRGRASQPKACHFRREGQFRRARRRRQEISEQGWRAKFGATQQRFFTHDAAEPTVRPTRRDLRAGPSDRSADGAYAIKSATGRLRAAFSVSSCLILRASASGPGAPAAWTISTPISPYRRHRASTRWALPLIGICSSNSSGSDMVLGTATFAPVPQVLRTMQSIEVSLASVVVRPPK